MFNDFVFSRWSRSKINGYIDTDRELMIIDFFQESNIQVPRKICKKSYTDEIIWNEISFEKRNVAQSTNLRNICIIFVFSNVSKIWKKRKAWTGYIYYWATA